MTTTAAFAAFIRTQTANCSSAPMHDDAAPAERSAATTKKLAAAGLR